MSILVIGGTGQLARHLREELPGAQFWDRATVDLADTALLERRLATVEPAAIVNAAAYTAVDKAESEPELAWRINAEAPAALARAARRLDVPLVQVSTDYVFDGARTEGYVETDGVGPLSMYGRSKLGGELAVSSLCSRYWILRTSWVFSEHGNNFAKTMLRLARERDELRVVDDQRGQPTYAGDLARCIAKLLAAPGDAAPAWGLHHVGAGPVVTWKQFAAAILQQAATTGLIARVPRLTGITTAEYPLAAARPGNSVLLTRETTAAWTREPFDWRRGLASMLAAMR